MTSHTVKLPSVKSCLKNTRSGPKPGKKAVEDEDFVQLQRRRQKRKELKKETKSSSAPVADLIRQSVKLMGDLQSENDFGKKCDLWMVAFDDPSEFIQYCRKRLDHERDLLEKSRQTENDIISLLRRWTEDTDKLAFVLDDLCKIQNHNDKLQEVIMEERTNCKHLVGSNYQLEAENKLLTRKYQASLMLGKVEDKSVTHLLERNPKAVVLTDKMCDLTDKIKKFDSKSKGAGDCADPYVLAEKVEQLENYIKDLKMQHREEVTVLKDAIGKYDMKYDSLKLHYKDALQRNTEAFEEVRELLAVSVRENLELREEILKKGDKFLQIQAHEVKKSSSKIQSDRHHRKNGVSSDDNEPDLIGDYLLEESIDGKMTEKDMRLKLSRMEVEIEEKSKLLKDVLNKLMALERTCARFKEENATLKSSYQHSLNALREKNQILQRRCEKTDERRKLDNAGFREEVRELRFLIKTLDKNVTKCIRSYGDLEAEIKAQPEISEEEYQMILDAQKAVDRQKAWLLKTDPKLVQNAMTGWTDFLEKKLDRLEDIIHLNKYKTSAHHHDN